MRNIITAAFLAAATPTKADSLPVNPDVTQGTVDSTICQHGYTRSIRPPVSFTNSVKIALMREEGLPLELIGDKILDHKISLSVGGAPSDLRNLVLQDRDDSYAKDRVEHCLREAICTGRTTLRDAQQAIWRDWRSAGSLCRI